VTRPASPPAAVSTVEVSAARSDPLVREALSLFDGTLVNVQRVAGSAGGPSANREH
jgi:hypothetical protein